MKTPKKAQVALMILGCIILGITPMNAQQNSNSIKVKTQSATALSPTPIASIDIVSIPVLEYYFHSGSDVSICKGETYSLSGINTSKIKAMWGTQGDGVFDNPYNLNAVYTPGKYDIKEGKVTLVLIGIDPDGYYPFMITDSMVILLKDLCGKPIVLPEN